MRRKGSYEYSYTFNWKPGSRPDAAALAESFQEQLGLVLEARRLNVDTIDVVSVKPALEVVMTGMIGFREYQFRAMKSDHPLLLTDGGVGVCLGGIGDGSRALSTGLCQLQRADRR